MLERLHFRMTVADGLLKVEKNINLERRKTLSSSSKPSPAQSQCSMEKRQAEDLQYDSTFQYKKEATRAGFQLAKGGHIFTVTNVICICA